MTAAPGADRTESGLCMESNKVKNPASTLNNMVEPRAALMFSHRDHVLVPPLTASGDSFVCLLHSSPPTTTFVLFLFLCYLKQVNLNVSQMHIRRRAEMIQVDVFVRK